MGRGIDREELGEVVTAEDLREIVTSFGDVLLVLDGDGQIQATAGTGEQLLPARPATLVGKPITHVFPSEQLTTAGFDVTTAEQFRKTVLAGGNDSVTVPFQGGDGSTVPMTLWVFERGKADGRICVAREITDREGPDRSEDILDTVADPLFVLDERYRFERVNDAMVEYTGYERGALLGREIGEILPVQSYERLTTHLAELVEEGRGASDTVETTVITDDGDLIVAEAQVTVRTDEDGEYANSVAVLRDIRERKRRERDLELLKQVLVRVFRHNVRNELMIVQGHTELLEDNVGEDLQAHTDRIFETVDRVLDHSEKARLIEQVIETTELYELEITTVIETILASAREAYPEARIEADLPTEWSVRAHPNIDKAIEELVENALEHAPTAEATSLSLWLDDDEEPRTLFIEDESGGLADNEITVLRKGAEDDLEHSSGVGLWLVRWLVEYSDAEMIVHRTDEGTLMGIRFAQQTADDDGQTPDMAESPLAKTPGHVRERSPERFRGETVITRVEARETLTNIYDSLERKGGHTALITGEAGIGKTTLVEQFCEGLSETDEPPAVAIGGCKENIGPPYHAFRRVLQALPGERDMAELLAGVSALSATDPEELQRQKRTLFADIADEIRRIAAEQSVVLVVEDMQWADSGTIALFEYLVEELGRWGRPVMLVGTYRTSGVEQSHPVLEIADGGRGTVLDLEPFGREEVEPLVCSMLDIDELPPSLVEAIYRHTGGNPLFVNELGRHLAESLGPVQSSEALPETLDDVTVPDTVERAITERLETLPEGVVPVLKLAAIVGTEFSFDVLRTASELPVHTLIGSINTLVRGGIWTRSADGIEFVHGVVRDQTLTTVDDAERETLHRRVAEAIETVHSEDIDEFAAQLATHYEQVGEYETAFQYYQQAGDEASETYAHEDAIDHYEQALSLAEDHDVGEDRTVLTLHTELGHLRKLLGDPDSARTCYEASLAISERMGDRRGEAQSLYNLGRVTLNLGEPEKAQEYYERSLALSREIDERHCESESLNGLGGIARRQGEYDRAREYLEQSIEIKREIGDREGEADSLYNLGVINHRQGEYDRAQEYYEQTLEIARDVGYREGEANSLNALGQMVLMRGEYERAQAYLEESLDIAREINDRQGEANTLTGLGNVARAQGAYDRGRDYLERSLEINREIGNRNEEAANLLNLGTLGLLQGKYAWAKDCVTAALEINRETGNRNAEAINLTSLGLIDTKLGAYDQARESLERSLEINREIGNRQGQAETLNGLGQIARSQGHYDRAREYLNRSLEISRDIGSRENETDSLVRLGKLARRLCEDDRALEYVTEALEIAREMNDPLPEIIALRELGRLDRGREEYEEAKEHLEESLALCDEGENPDLLAKVHLERARLALARGDVESAQDAAEAAQRLFTRLDMSHYCALTTLLQGRIAAAADSPDEAREHWRAALETFEDVGVPRDTLRTLQLLTRTCREQNDTERAREWVEHATTVVENAPEPFSSPNRDWLDG